MSIGLTVFTLIHVVLSLIGILAGIVVLLGFLRGKLHKGWIALFLITTVLTSITGYGFPFVKLLPAHIVGAVSLVILVIASMALYSQHLAGRWRTAFVLSSVAALYLNSLVGVAQLFRRVPFLHALAPTESEPPFMAAQVVLLVVFIGLGWLAVRGFTARVPVPR
jgi:hypothetical protein